MLMQALEDAGINALQTREPGGSPGAEAIRSLLLGGAEERWDAVSETLLFYAARHDHVARLIEPALALGQWVVCDRFADSTFAYQGYGRGLALADLQCLHHFAIGGFAPDLTLILDLPAAEGLARAQRRTEGPDRFERLDVAFHERLQRGFRRIAADNPARCVVIDAMPDPDQVHHAVLRAIADRLGIDLGR
jgi:dTMP kinase